jgi:hypothetical protein
MSHKAFEVKNQSVEITTQSKQSPKPNSVLKSLERLVGTWKATDPSGAGAIAGEATFEWMEGGNFLLQHLDFGDSKGIEIIGFDEESKSLRSHYFDRSGKILEYTYELHNDTLTVSINMPRAKGQFISKFSDNGNTYTGRWNWIQDGVKKSYDAMMTKSRNVESGCDKTHLS